MTTSRFLILVFAFLSAMSFLAYLWRPNADLKGKTPLIWVSDNNPARSEQIKAFNEENPGLSLSLDYSNNGTQKVILQSASGVGPDIFDVGDADLQTYVESGIIWDVTEAAQKMGFAAEKDGWPGAVGVLQCFGKQYAFPCNLGVTTLIYNKNVFDHFGVPYPTGPMTWDEYIELAKKVSNAADPNVKPADKIYASTMLDWKTYFSSLRGEYFTESGIPVIRDNPALREALQFHKDMLFKYKLMPSTLDIQSMSGQGGWGGGSLGYFSEGHFAMVFTGDWSLIAISRSHDYQQTQMQKAGTDVKAVPALDRPVRVGSVLMPYIAGSTPSYTVGSRMAGINAKSPRKEEALKFLQYLAGPTYSRLLNEGTDFLPGNPKYADLGVNELHEDLSRVQMHETSKEAMKFAYFPRRSRFLLTSDLMRIMTAQISRLETNENLEVQSLMDAAADELQTLMRRNLDRSPELKKDYEEALKQHEQAKTKS